MDNIQDLANQLAALQTEIEQLKLQTVPVGVIEAFAMREIPDGWLICDGKMYRNELFPSLSKVLGTMYNQSDIPDGFFCVPDLQGMFIRGWDNDGNVDSERQLGSVQEDAMQGHSHYFDSNNLKISIKRDGYHNHSLWCCEYSTPTSGLNKCKRMADPSTERGYRDTDLGPYAGSHSHECVLTMDNNPVKNMVASKFGVPRVEIETRPKNVALMYCIKAK